MGRTLFKTSTFFFSSSRSPCAIAKLKSHVDVVLTKVLHVDQHGALVDILRLDVIFELDVGVANVRQRSRHINMVWAKELQIDVQGALRHPSPRRSLRARCRRCLGLSTWSPPQSGPRRNASPKSWGRAPGPSSSSAGPRRVQRSCPSWSTRAQLEHGPCRCTHWAPKLSRASLYWCSGLPLHQRSCSSTRGCQPAAKEPWRMEPSWTISNRQLQALWPIPQPSYALPLECQPSPCYSCPSWTSWKRPNLR